MLMIHVQRKQALKNYIIGIIPYTLNVRIKYRDMREVIIIYHIIDLSLDISEYDNDHISRGGIYSERKQLNFADIKFVVQ